MVDETIEEKYIRMCATPSDINIHLPVLKLYADECESVTEFGVRGGISLTAFLASKAKKVTGYDLYLPDIKDEKLTLIQGDTLQVEIEQTDMLHIDSKHTYGQMREELTKHNIYVNKFIFCHDVTTFGLDGEDGERGVLPAILQFVATMQFTWRICYYNYENNGMIGLLRK